MGTIPAGMLPRLDFVKVCEVTFTEIGEARE